MQDGSTVRVRFDSAADATYQFYSSGDLTSWSLEGDPVAGTGEPIEVLFEVDPDGNRFFRVARGGGGSGTSLKFMTWNLYVGTDVTQLTQANTLLEILSLTPVMFQQVQDTAFEDRVVRIAEAIAAADPDVIGLQEVADYRIQTPSDFLATGFVPNAEDPYQDFLALLEAEFERLGLRYQVVITQQNTDAELPVPQGLQASDLRLIDRDVLLVREGIEVLGTTNALYETLFELEIAALNGQVIPSPRGYVGAEISVNGQTLTVLNSHIEIAPPEDVQIAQAAELLEATSAIAGPVVILTDLNSVPAGEGSTAYQTLVGPDRFTDAQGNGTLDAPTCCEAANLSNAESVLGVRVDYVLYRGPFAVEGIERVGHLPADRTESGLWPSDHAAVVATLRLESLKSRTR